MGLEDKLKNSVDSLKDKAESVVGDTGEIGENIADKAKDKIDDVAADVEGKVGDTVSNLKDKLPG